jgi:hypothetical protein
VLDEFVSDSLSIIDFYRRTGEKIGLAFGLDQFANWLAIEIVAIALDYNHWQANDW